MAPRGKDDNRRRRTHGGVLATVLTLALAAPAFGAVSFLASWGDDEHLGPQARGIAVDAAGRVLVTDRLRDRVLTYTSEGGFLDEWGGVQGPTGVAPAPDGDVYVSDADRVRRFDETGAAVSSFGQFRGTGGVAAAPDGTVYVTDTGRERVERFDAFGGALGGWDVADPRGVAVGLDGTVYVASHGPGRVERFTATGTALSPWTGTSPEGVATGPDGTIYVADAARHRVVRYTTAGVATEAVGAGTGGDQLNGPVAVTADCRGSLYVTDGSDERVHKYGDSAAGQPPCPPPPAPAAPQPPPQIQVQTVLVQQELAPTLGVTALAEPIGGRVLVSSPDPLRRDATVLTGKSLVAIGSTIDATNGRVRLTFATAPGADRQVYGPTQSTELFEGAVTIFQSRTASLVDLRLAGAEPQCTTATTPKPKTEKSATARAAATSGRKKRYVWGDGRGRFRTTGNHGAATVRGTRWLTEDTCAGTRVRVSRGVVDVRDFTKRTTVTVGAGKEYIARARCASRRDFRINLQVPPGTVVRRVTVLVNGKPVGVRVTAGAKPTARIDLRRRPKGTVKVRITVQTAAGEVLTGVRSYRTCVPDMLPAGDPPTL